MNGWFGSKPLILDRLRPSEQLTSKQMVCQWFISFAWMPTQSVYFSRLQLAGPNNILYIFLYEWMFFTVHWPSNRLSREQVVDQAVSYKIA